MAQRDRGQEGRCWPQAEGPVGCKENPLCNSWDSVPCENVGPLIKNFEEFLDGNSRVVNQAQALLSPGPSVATAAQIREVFELLCNCCQKDEPGL